MAAFVHKAIGFLHGEIRVVTNHRKQQRACLRCTHRGEDGEPVDWFVMGIVWPATMLMCSINGQPGDPAIRDAERMLASIVPLGPTPVAALATVTAARERTAPVV